MQIQYISTKMLLLEVVFWTLLWGHRCQCVGPHGRCSSLLEDPRDIQLGLCFFCSLNVCNCECYACSGLLDSASDSDDNIESIPACLSGLMYLMIHLLENNKEQTNTQHTNKQIKSRFTDMPGPTMNSAGDAGTERQIEGAGKGCQKICRKIEGEHSSWLCCLWVLYSLWRRYDETIKEFQCSRKRDESVV